MFGKHGAQSLIQALSESQALVVRTDLGLSLGLSFPISSDLKWLLVWASQPLFWGLAETQSTGRYLPVDSLILLALSASAKSALNEFVDVKVGSMPAGSY